MGIIDFDNLQSTLEKIVHYYDRVSPAPTVSNWANDLYIRVSEDIDSIRMVEIMMADRLYSERDGMMNPSEAANQVFKLMNRLGQDTTGHCGY
jgi:hypothetical protein